MMRRKTLSRPGPGEKKKKKKCGREERPRKRIDSGADNLLLTKVLMNPLIYLLSRGLVLLFSPTCQPCQRSRRI